MNEIIVVENKPLTAAEIKANVNRLQEVMKAVMIGPSKECPEGVHYGIIPGTKKPTLYKAGSEKILATFRIAVELEVEDLSTSDCFRYRVKARGVIPSGEIVGCGIGECSTDEEKYKWRSSINDREWGATPEDRKRIKYVKPTDWNKEGEIRQIRTNPADFANTALKMAKKRAQIDLTLTATAASDVFEQDLDELPPEYVEGMRGDQQKGKPPVNPPQSKSGKEEKKQEGTINENQKKLVYVKLKQANITEDSFKVHYGIEHLADLPADKMNDALEAIKTGSIAEVKPKEKAPEICAECRQPLDDTGTCRNLSCPDGKPLEDEQGDLPS